MDRKQCIKHGKSEVLVVFEDAGELRNHLLRDAGDLAERYSAHDANAKTRRASLEETIKGERDAIDADAFARAEEEIAAANAPAAEVQGDG